MKTHAIQYEKYPNDFYFVHQKAPHKLPLCSIHLFCDVGSAFETNELRGIAHFLEHMLFQGTKQRSAEQIFEEYDRIGTQFNAYTTKRYTCFYVKCHIRHSKRVLQLLSDVMRNSVIQKDTIHKESKVVQQENRNRLNNYKARTQSEFERRIYQNSSFEFPIDDIVYRGKSEQPISQDTLREWYHWFYRPSNMVLSVVSNESMTYWKKILFRTSFTQTPFRSVEDAKPKHALSFPIQHNIPYKSEIDITAKREKDMENTHLVLGFRTVNQYSDKKYLFSMLTHVLNGMSGRLFTLLRQDHPLVYYATASADQEEYTGYFSVTTEFEDGHLEKVVELLVALFSDLAKNGIKPKEFEIAQSRIRGTHTILYENTDTFASHNGHDFLVFVRDTDNARHYKKTKVAPFETILETHYKPITIAQLNSLIREYFHPQNMVVALMSSKKVSLAKLKTLCEKMAE